jgi:hypothetical protein
VFTSNPDALNYLKQPVSQLAGTNVVTFADIAARAGGQVSAASLCVAVLGIATNAYERQLPVSKWPLSPVSPAGIKAIQAGFGYAEMSNAN